MNWNDHESEFFCGAQDTTWFSPSCPSFLPSYFPPSRSPQIHNIIGSTSCWINTFYSLSHNNSKLRSIVTTSIYFFSPITLSKSVLGPHTIFHKGQLILAYRSKLHMSLSSFILPDNSWMTWNTTVGFHMTKINKCYIEHDTFWGA